MFGKREQSDISSPAVALNTVCVCEREFTKRGTQEAKKRQRTERREEGDRSR